MAIVSFEINDFRLGVVGAKRLGSGDSSTPYEGFLRMDECVLVGTSLTKRPPIKYISRTVDNVPKNNQFLSYGEFLFYAVGETRAFIIEDGERISTYSDVFKITKFAEENISDIVVLDKPLDASKGEFILAFIGQQPMEVYDWQAISGQTNTYRIHSITANKGYAPNNLDSFKQVVVKTISVGDYVDSVGGTYVTGSKTAGFNIASDGTVTANILYADSITMLGSEIVIASSSATGVTVTFVFANGNPSQNLSLVKEIGTTVFWIRAISNGLILATDMGVFLLVLDGQTLKNLMKIDDRTSSNVKPVLFKQYILYADTGGESLSYIRTSFSNNYVWASALELAVDNDLFIGRGGIKRLGLYYYNNSPNIIALTNDGSCLVGQINQNSREDEIVASMSEWFLPYDINDIAIFRQSSTQNRLTMSISFQGLTMLGVINAQQPPLFNQEAPTLPYVDFYSDIRSDLMFNTQQNLVCERIGNENSSTFRVTSNADFFKTAFFNCSIFDGMFRLRVSDILSSREAICEAKHGADIGGSQYVMHAGTYMVRFDFFSNLNHLYHLMFNGQQNKLCGYVDDEPVKFNFNYPTGIFSFPYCSRLVVGLAYNMVVCTTQLLPFGFSNRIRSGYYSDLQVTLQTLGYNYRESYAFVGTSDGLLGSENATTTSYVEFPNNKKFINSMQIAVPASTNNCLLLWLSSDAVNPPFISNIAVKFDYENT